MLIYYDTFLNGAILALYKVISEIVWHITKYQQRSSAKEIDFSLREICFEKNVQLSELISLLDVKRSPTQSIFSDLCIDKIVVVFTARRSTTMRLPTILPLRYYNAVCISVHIKIIVRQANTVQYFYLDINSREMSNH